MLCFCRSAFLGLELCASHGWRAMAPNMLRVCFRLGLVSILFSGSSLHPMNFWRKFFSPSNKQFSQHEHTIAPSEVRLSYQPLIKTRHFYGSRAFIWYVESLYTCYSSWVMCEQKEEGKKERKKKEEERKKMNKIKIFMFVFLSFCMG